MNKTAIYLRLQLRRAAKLLPQMLAVTLLLAVLTALAALMLSRLQADDRSRELVRVGVVGNLEEGYLGEGLEMLQSMDSSRFSLRLEPMEEPEAERALRRGEIGAYVAVPEGFAHGLMTGEHQVIRYVSASSGADLGALVTRELAEAIASLVLETENAIYGAQNYAAEQVPGVNPYAVGDRLVFRYMLRALDRERIFDLETEDESRTLSLPGYYLCGVSLAFLMLWAISCSPLFSGRSRELGQILQADGLPAAAQVGAEFLSYALLMLGGLLCAGALCALLLSRFGVQIPELAARGGLLRLLPAALSAALMLCALQFFLYELAEGVIGGVLLQFLNAAVQGYLAGCFYPSSFFPDALRRFGAALPAGAAMELMGGQLLGESAGRAAMAVWGYALLFLLMTVLLRRRRARN